MGMIPITTVPNFNWAFGLGICKSSHFCEKFIRAL